MEFELKYGDRHHALTISEKADVSVLRPSGMTAVADLEAAMEDALSNPIGSERFERQIKARKPQNVSIAIPDETRPVPSGRLLTVLVRRLFAALPDLDTKAVTIVIGGGLHPPMDIDALRQILPGRLFEQCRVITHDATHSTMFD